MTHYSYNQFHLGDNLVHLHFLRALAQRYPTEQFVHAVHPCYLKELNDVVVDLGGTNIRLVSLEDEGLRGRNAWKNADGFWAEHPLKHHFALFYLLWFQKLAAEMGLVSPLQTPADLLFDYPSIPRSDLRRVDYHEQRPDFDILFINSRPCSGQFMAYDRLHYFDPLINDLLRRGHRIFVTQQTDLQRVWPVWSLRCTQDYGLSLAQIGRLSFRCRAVMGIATGPMWPTFNAWNKESVELRVICLEKEKLELTPNTFHAADEGQVRAILKEKGWL